MLGMPQWGGKLYERIISALKIIVTAASMRDWVFTRLVSVSLIPIYTRVLRSTRQGKLAEWFIAPVC